MRLSMKAFSSCVILSAAIVLAGCKDSEPQADPATRQIAQQRLEQARTRKPTLPAGSAAIPAARSTASTIAVDDVRAFVTAHPVPMSVNSTSEFKIVRIDFLPSKEITPLLRGASTGFPDDYPLCYVELQGSFAFGGPNGAVVTFPRGVEIFDARTGNFLISGGLPAVQPTGKP